MSTLTLYHLNQVVEETTYENSILAEIVAEEMSYAGYSTCVSNS